VLAAKSSTTPSEQEALPMTAREQRGLLLAALLTSISLCGCGPSMGSLSGKVTYGGKELTTGTVLLLGSDGIPLTAAIGPDGSYRFDRAPVGPAQIGVSSPDPVVEKQKIDNWSAGRGRVKGKEEKPKPAPARSAVGSGWFPIPAKYATPEKSGLEYTIKGVGDTHQIALTD
jgi:hypothetical protein